MHGFLMTRPFTITTTLCTLDEAMITCTYRHDGSHAAYPFRFVFEVSYILRGSSFDVEMVFTNNDASTVPVGLGWHPYFKIAEKADDIFMQIPDCQIVEADERQLPTGKKQPFSAFKTLAQIHDFKLDNTFLLNQTDGRAEVMLRSESGVLTYWQNVDNQNWQFLQIFIPPARKSIALEPMSCNVDAFNNQEGLKCLKTGEILRGVFGVQFSKK
ncbi:MAG: aldose 1-epimerase [Saprospiraceae bacterium]|nr:aldose 1-epimerase [Saprospiraceae bacterium]